MGTVEIQKATFAQKKIPARRCIRLEIKFQKAHKPSTTLNMFFCFAMHFLCATLESHRGEARIVVNAN